MSEVQKDPHQVVLDDLRKSVKEFADKQPAIRAVAVIVDWTTSQAQKRLPLGFCHLQENTLTPMDALALVQRFAEFQTEFCRSNVRAFTEFIQQKEAASAKSIDSSLGERSTLQPGTGEGHPKS